LNSLADSSKRALLRAARFDALDVDAEAGPPDGGLGEIEEGLD
jgi:hypothetical protein